MMTSKYPEIRVAKGRVVVYETTGEDLRQMSRPTGDDYESEIGPYKYVQWYDTNEFALELYQHIRRNPVLRRALTTYCSIALGQGVFPCRVVDIQANGQEVLEVVKDPDLLNMLHSYPVRRYLQRAAWDRQAYGNAYVQLMFNKAGNKILYPIAINALHARLAVQQPASMFHQILISGFWPSPAITEITPYTLLDEHAPEMSLQHALAKGKTKGSVFMHLKNDMDNSDYYALPEWHSAVNWAKIAQKVPTIIEAGMDNTLNVFVHVRIPYVYWEEKYPESLFTSAEERKQMINADLGRLEKEFTSVENTRKALITFFGSDNAGPLGDKWEIDIVQAKFSQENFVTSTAADSQVAIAVGINPDLMGLMYGNSKGGSMQRELLLIQYALAWGIREQLAEPLEMAIKFNWGKKYDDLQLRFRNTFLTTLDTGTGSDIVLS
jgi:hypothetical protein